jgi:xanthine dehydrogenase accessory factor
VTALGEQVDALRSERTPFVLATVVRAQPPTSARPGDRAVLLADGSMRGFVGGDCAVDTVRDQALRLLPSGSSTLLRITPSSAEETAATAIEGMVTVGNPCASGGALDIFLESVLPPLLVAVYGDAPVARALAEVGAAADAEVRGVDWPTEFPDDLDAMVLASHGRGAEADVLTAAVRAEVPYVGLIASPRRGKAVLDALDVPAELCARVHTPAGLDIGAHAPGEIAVSVLAELIRERPRHALPEPTPSGYCCHHEHC